MRFAAAARYWSPAGSRRFLRDDDGLRPCRSRSRAGRFRHGRPDHGSRLRVCLNGSRSYGASRPHRGRSSFRRLRFRWRFLHWRDRLGRGLDGCRLGLPVCTSRCGAPLANSLPDHDTRAGLLFRHRHADVERPRCSIELKTTERRASMRIRHGEVSPQTAGQNAARPFLGELETRPRTFHRLAGGVGYLNRDGFHYVRTRRVRRILSGNNRDKQRAALRRRRARDEKRNRPDTRHAQGFEDLGHLMVLFFTRTVKWRKENSPPEAAGVCLLLVVGWGGPGHHPAQDHAGDIVGAASLFGLVHQLLALILQLVVPRHIVAEDVFNR